MATREPGTLGSWAPLLLVMAVFATAFVIARGRCPTLLVEAKAEAAHTLAKQSGVPVADVMALWEIVGPSAAPTDVEARCRVYAKSRAELGDGPAAALALGPGHELGTRFLSRRERFAARAAAAPR